MLQVYDLSIDIETFSSVDLKAFGLYKYVQSPDFEILLIAYCYEGETIQLIDLTKSTVNVYSLNELILGLKNPNVIKHAYNATFEWYCLSKWLNLTHEQSLKWLSEWRCTMFHGLYCGYTAGLEATGVALGLPEDKKKSDTGKALIRTFCMPVKPTRSNGYRNRILSKYEPEKWELFKEYCKQDVIAEMEIKRKLSAFPIPVYEQHLWELDQKINETGVCVDKKLVEGALNISELSTVALTEEAVSLSGLDNPKSVKQLSEWLIEELDEEVPNLQKTTVDALIRNTDNDVVKRMLQIRQELSKTSVKKYMAMNNALGDDGRIRGLLQFYGANRTGRWAGRLVQVQNLPKNRLDTLLLARELTINQKIDTIKFMYSNVPDTLSQLVRTAFVPSYGNKLIVADFSAIEARIIAWLAGEQWRMDVFAGHGKIYEASASTMFGVPIERIKKGNPEYELRQKGKIAELALGYQGGTGALKKMGALDMGLCEDELPDIVRRWRASNRRIVDLWHCIQNAAFETMRTSRMVGVKGLIFSHEGDFYTGQDFLTITLPSGRKLYYVKPFITPNQWGKDGINYYGMDQKTKKWTVINTYGGKLVENIVQAIARDCLAKSLIRLDNAGYKTVMHIHDEVVIDAPQNEKLEDVCNIMGQPISWANGLLLKAEGFESLFYKKN